MLMSGRLAVAATVVALLPTLAAAVDLDRDVLESLEGRPVTRLTFTGHKTTRPFVIERELHVKVGDPLDIDALSSDLVSLENLNIFASIVATGQPDGDGVAIDISLKEMPPVIPFVAFKYTEEDGFSVGPALSSLNLSGRGIRVSARAMFWGTRTFSAKVGYPWITGNHVSLDGLAADLRRDDEVREFQEDSLEVTPWVGTYLGQHGRLAGTLSYFRMKSDRDGITLGSDNDDRLHRAGLRLGWDTRDSWRNPQRGWQNELELWRTGGFLGGDGDSWAMNLDLRRFHPTAPRQTLALGSLLSLQSGIVGEDVPSYLQYHIGGASTVRGHDVKDLGKRLYGKNQLLATAEYRLLALPVRRFDLWKFSVSLGAEVAAFFDTGVAWDEPHQLALNRFASGGGLGLRILVPGTEQVRLDLGYSREGGFQFHFGTWSKFSAQRERVR